MNMLRDFVGEPRLELLIPVLERFEVEEAPILLFLFKYLTPDSFVWKLSIGQDHFYLYAEDYIPSLEHVREQIDHFIPDHEWEFVKARQPIAFDDATPVKEASVYKRPADEQEIMKYAIDSGHEFVFLCRVLTP